MGNGRWAPDTYYDRAAARQRAGMDAFDYSRKAVETGNLSVHPTLDPRNLTTPEPGQ